MNTIQLRHKTLAKNLIAELSEVIFLNSAQRKTIIDYIDQLITSESNETMQKVKQLSTKIIIETTI